MPTYEIRNRLTKMVLGEVVVDRPEDVLNEWMGESGMTIEDIFKAFGGSIETVRETLDIAEVEPRGPEIKHVATTPLGRALPPRRRQLFRMH